jgi:nucleotide-binding universal stress UspA family protein
MLDKVETVLVPVDGSPFSQRAVPVAAWLADRFGAHLHLLSTVPKADDVDQREAELTALKIPGHGLCYEVVVDLDPAGEIHEALRRLSPAVVCMATHGRGRSAALLGSVAKDVIARGHDPVVMVGPMVDEAWSGGSGIIVCVDGTPASAELLPVALAWLALVLEPLTVLTVAEPVPKPLRPGKVRRVFGPDGDPDAFLEGLVKSWRNNGHDIDTQTVWDPVSPADGVCSYIDEQRTALAILGSRARTALPRMVLGSVSAAVVHRSPSPAVVVPQQ